MKDVLEKLRLWRAHEALRRFVASFRREKHSFRPVVVADTDLWGWMQREMAGERAEARGLKLLRPVLEERQWEDFVRSGAFLIYGASGRCYRIRRNAFPNVDLIDANGQISKRLCLMAQEPLPVSDTVLAQTLMIRHEEETFLALAKPHRSLSSVVRKSRNCYIVMWGCILLQILRNVYGYYTAPHVELLWPVCSIIGVLSGLAVDRYGRSALESFQGILREQEGMPVPLTESL